MTNTTTTITAEPGSPVIELERVFAATPEQLLRAHVEPELIKRWLGPARLEMDIEEMDVRHGGRYRFVHREPGTGQEFGFRGVFHGEATVDGMTRTFEYEGAPGHVSLEQLWFEPLGDGRTRLHARAIHTSVEARDAMIQAGMEVGVNEGYAKLDALLAEG